MYIKNNRGQSTVEYILLVTAVVAVMIVFVTSSTPGGFKYTLNSTLNSATQDMNSMVDTLGGSHALAPAGAATAAPYTVNPIPQANAAP